MRWKIKNESEWKWFAWKPVKIDNEWVWLEWVMKVRIWKGRYKYENLNYKPLVGRRVRTSGIAIK